ncbi:MAG TPA: hypothetical protein VF897_05955, partial [Roseiflexaceae bacterium]
MHAIGSAYLAAVGVSAAGILVALLFTPVGEVVQEVLRAPLAQLLPSDHLVPTPMALVTPTAPPIATPTLVPVP